MTVEKSPSSIIDSVIKECKQYFISKGITEDTLSAFSSEGKKLSVVISEHYKNDTEGAASFAALMQNLIDTSGIPLNTEKEINDFTCKIRVTFSLPYFTCLVLNKFSKPMLKNDIVFGRCYEEARDNLVAKLKEQPEEEPDDTTGSSTDNNTDTVDGDGDE